MKILERGLQGGVIAAFFVSSIASAWAQGTIQQSGPATSGQPTIFIQNGIVRSAGPASGGGAGVGISELLRTVRGNGTPPYANAGTGPLGENDCNYDAPITNPTGYHYLCFSPNAQGGGLIDYGYGGGASPLPFNFIINGTSIGTQGFRIVQSGVVDQATVLDQTIAWKSVVAAPKTELLYPCTALTLGNMVGVKDEIGTSDLYVITIVPNGTDTIDFFPSWPIFVTLQFGKFQCDGLGNWVVE